MRAPNPQERPVLWETSGRIYGYPIHRENVMKALLFKINRWGLLLSLLYSAPHAVAQFVDLRAQIEVYHWSLAPARTINIHCVVGTNSWEMDGDFCGNCDQAYWFTGKRIIEHSVT